MIGSFSAKIDRKPSSPLSARFCPDCGASVVLIPGAGKIAFTVECRIPICGYVLTAEPRDQCCPQCNDPRPMIVGYEREGFVSFTCRACHSLHFEQWVKFQNE